MAKTRSPGSSVTLDPREDRRDAGARLLSAYLDLVSATLTTNGFTCHRIRMTSGRQLHARLSLTPAHRSRTGSPRTITLCWDEYTGWSITHTLLRTTPNPWRYLHSHLAPSPDAVAGFVTTVLTDPGGLTMSYPAQFRRTHQPLDEVLSALTQHTAAPNAALNTPDRRQRAT